MRREVFSPDNKLKRYFTTKKINIISAKKRENERERERESEKKNSQVNNSIDLKYAYEKSIDPIFLTAIVNISSHTIRKNKIMFAMMIDVFFFFFFFAWEILFSCEMFVSTCVRRPVSDAN